MTNQNMKPNNLERTEYIEIGSDNHQKLITKLKDSSSILSKVIENCNIEVFNNQILILNFNKPSIHSETAKRFKDQLHKEFINIVKKEIEVRIEVKNDNLSDFSF